MSQPSVPSNYTVVSKFETDIDIDITLLNTRVKTVRLREQDRYFVSVDENDGLRRLMISVETKIYEYDYIGNNYIYARPELLVILGFLSYYTFEPFSVLSDYMGMHRSEVASVPKPKKRKFNVDGISYLPHLDELNAFLSNSNLESQTLLYSLLDRFRKGLFLEKEGQDNMIYDDEILLTYFHILELLSDFYKVRLDMEFNKSLDDFTQSVLNKTFLLEGQTLQDNFYKKRKLLVEIFNSDFTVGNCISYMLQQQGILNTRLKAFVKETINARNDVAHGRQGYKDRLIFPVPPFFPLIKDRHHNVEVLRLLAGRSIALFMNSNYLKMEWEDVSKNLPPTVDEVKTFIKEERFKGLSREDFRNGTIDDIGPYIISYYLGERRLNVKDVIPSIKDYLMSIEEEEEEISNMVIAASVIADEADNELKNKCKEIILIAYKNRWIPDFNLRFLMQYLQSKNHKVRTLTEMVEDRSVR